MNGIEPRDITVKVKTARLYRRMYIWRGKVEIPVKVSKEVLGYSNYLHYYVFRSNLVII